MALAGWLARRATPGPSPPARRRSRRRSGGGSGGSKSCSSSRRGSKSPDMAVDPPLWPCGRNLFAGHEFVEVEQYAGDGDPSGRRRITTRHNGCDAVADDEAWRSAPSARSCWSTSSSNPSSRSSGGRPRQSMKACRIRSRSVAGSRPLGRSIRAASPAAISTNAGSLSSVRACKRRVGSEAAGAGLHAPRRVEGRQERVRRRPPEERIQTAAIAVRARNRPATAASSDPGS